MRTNEQWRNEEQGRRLILGGRIGVVLRDSHGVAQVKVVTGMDGIILSWLDDEKLTRLQVTRSYVSYVPTV